MSSCRKFFLDEFKGYQGDKGGLCNIIICGAVRWIDDESKKCDWGCWAVLPNYITKYNYFVWYCSKECAPKNVGFLREIKAKIKAKKTEQLKKRKIEKNKKNV